MGCRSASEGRSPAEAETLRKRVPGSTPEHHTARRAEQMRDIVGRSR